MNTLLGALGLLFCLLPVILLRHTLTRAHPGGPHALAALALAPLLLGATFAGVWPLGALCLRTVRRGAERVFAHSEPEGLLRFCALATDNRLLGEACAAMASCFAGAAGVSLVLLLQRGRVTAALTVLALLGCALAVYLRRGTPVRFSRLPLPPVPAELDAGNPPPLPWRSIAWDWTPSPGLLAASEVEPPGAPATFRLAGDRERRGDDGAGLPEGVPDPVVQQLAVQFSELMNRLGWQRQPRALALSALEVVTQARRAGALAPAPAPPFAPPTSTGGAGGATATAGAGWRVLFGKPASPADLGGIALDILGACPTAAIRAAEAASDDPAASGPLLRIEGVPAWLTEDGPGWSLSAPPRPCGPQAGLQAPAGATAGPGPTARR